MRAPVFALTALLAAGLLAPVSGIAAEPATPDALAAQAATLRVTTRSNANVRFGPSTEAKVAVMLKSGDEVEILGEARVKDWYVIRFPKKARAWVHKKVLTPLDDGKRWRVTMDAARARDDATLGGGIVAELREGEVLEDRGDVKGDWIAVTLPNAVAYISGKVINLPADLTSAKQSSAERANAAVTTWSTAQKAYEEFRTEVQANKDAANYLDWDGLGGLLDTVIRDHGDVQVRIAAQRLKDGITNVSSAAAAYQKAKGIKPAVRPGDWQRLAQANSTTPVEATSPGMTVPTPTVATTTPTATTPTFVEPGTVVAQAKPMAPDAKLADPLEPKLLPIPGATPETTPTPPVVKAIPVAPLPDVPVVGTTPAAKTWAVQGILSQQDNQTLGSGYVLLDGDSNVIAFLRAKAGAEVPFSEYYWRDVGVSGTSAPTDPATNGLGRAVPLITVDAIGLSGR